MRILSPSPTALGYLALVSILATVGFVRGTTWLVLAAAVLSLPAALLALPAYYLVYGALALLPGANPDLSAGGGTMAPDGHVVSVVTSGDPARWFTVGSDVLGVTALLMAAVANVLLVRVLASRRAKAGAGSG